MTGSATGTGAGRGAGAGGVATGGGAAGAVATESRRRGLPGALRDVVSPSTWLAVIHLLWGLFVGLAGCVVAVTGIAVGLGTVPAALIGIPILATASAGRTLAGRACPGWRRGSRAWMGSFA